MAEETITLPKSGLVLRRLHTRCEMYGPIDPTPVLFQVKALADGTGFQACFASSWHNGTRDECLAWIDEKALKFRAALLPPGAIVVEDSPETVERVARELWLYNEGENCPWSWSGESGAVVPDGTKIAVREQARAALAALRESRP